MRTRCSDGKKERAQRRGQRGRDAGPEPAERECRAFLAARSTRFQNADPIARESTAAVNSIGLRAPGPASALVSPLSILTSRELAELAQKSISLRSRASTRQIRPPDQPEAAKRATPSRGARGGDATRLNRGSKLFHAT